MLLQCVQIASWRQGTGHIGSSGLPILEIRQRLPLNIQQEVSKPAASQRMVAIVFNQPWKQGFKLPLHGRGSLQRSIIAVQISILCVLPAKCRRESMHLHQYLSTSLSHQLRTYSAVGRRGGRRGGTAWQDGVVGRRGATGWQEGTVGGMVGQHGRCLGCDGVWLGGVWLW